MTPVYRLAKLHLAFLALLFPYLMLLYGDWTAGDLSGSRSFWGYASVAVLYGGMAFARAPQALFDGLSRMGVSRKAAPFLISSAALFAASMVVGNLVYILGGLVIGVALLLFLWAMVITLFDKNQGAGVT